MTTKRHLWAFDLIGGNYRCVPHPSLNTDRLSCAGCGVIVTDDQLAVRFREQIPELSDYREAAPIMVMIMLNHVASEVAKS